MVFKTRYECETILIPVPLFPPKFWGVPFGIDQWCCVPTYRRQ